MSLKKILAPLISIEDVDDPQARENFRRIDSFFREDTNLKGFQHFEIVLEAAVTNKKYPHNLGFTPKDVIVTSLIGAGAITWNYELFDSENLDLTTTGAVTIRAYIGTHVEGSL